MPLRRLSFHNDNDLLNGNKTHLTHESCGLKEQVIGEIILQLRKCVIREDGPQVQIFWVPVLFDLGQVS